MPHTPVAGTSTKQVGHTAATLSGATVRRGVARGAEDRVVERRTDAARSGAAGAGGGGTCAEQWKRTTPAWLFGLWRRTAQSSLRSRTSEDGPQSEQRVGSPGTTSETRTGTSKGSCARQSDDPVIFTPPRYAHQGGSADLDQAGNATSRSNSATRSRSLAVKRANTLCSAARASACARS